MILIIVEMLVLAELWSITRDAATKIIYKDTIRPCFHDRADPRHHLILVLFDVRAGGVHVLGIFRFPETRTLQAALLIDFNELGVAFQIYALVDCRGKTLIERHIGKAANAEGVAT